MIAFLDWEGRNYNAADWDADYTNLKAMFGDKPLYAGCYDVGIMFSDFPSIPNLSELKVTYIRRGSVNLNEPFEYESIELTSYKRYENLAEWWEKWSAYEASLEQCSGDNGIQIITYVNCPRELDMEDVIHLIQNAQLPGVKWTYLRPDEMVGFKNTFTTDHGVMVLHHGVGTKAEVLLELHKRVGSYDE